jgi:hypothetical protein
MKILTFTEGFWLGAYIRIFAKVEGGDSSFHVINDSLGNVQGILRYNSIP